MSKEAERENNRHCTAEAGLPFRPLSSPNKRVSSRSSLPQADLLRTARGRAGGLPCATSPHLQPVLQTICCEVTPL